MIAACIGRSGAATILVLILVAAQCGGAWGLTEKLLVREGNQLQLVIIGPRPENGSLSEVVKLPASQVFGMSKGLGSTGSLAFAASSDGRNDSYISVIDVSGSAPQVLVNKKLSVGTACVLSNGVAAYRLAGSKYKVFVTATCSCSTGVRQQQTVSVLSLTYTAASKTFSSPSKTQYSISTSTQCGFSDRDVVQLRAVSSKLYALTYEGYCTDTKYRLKQLTDGKMVDLGAGGEGVGDEGCVLSTGGIASGTSFVATCLPVDTDAKGSNKNPFTAAVSRDRRMPWPVAFWQSVKTGMPVVDGECGTGSPANLVRYSKYAKPKTVYTQPDIGSDSGPEIYSLAVTSDRTYYVETDFQADRINGTFLKTLSKFGGAPIISARAPLIGQLVYVSGKTDGIMNDSI